MYGSGRFKSSLNRQTALYVPNDRCSWLLTVEENFVRTDHLIHDI